MKRSLVWLNDSNGEHQEPNDQFSSKEDAEDECLHLNLGKLRQEGQMANDLIQQPRELNEDPIQKDIVATTSSSPIEKDISACQEGIGHLVDELKKETCQSRIPITDDQCSQPLVRLPRRDDIRLCRPDDNFVARIPEALVVTSGENGIVTDEDMVVLRPQVQLPGYRRLEKREEFRENTLSLHAEEVLRHQCQDAKNICQKDTSPLSPLLDAEEANEKWSCYHFLGLDPLKKLLSS